MMSSEAAPYSPVSYGKYYYSSLASIISFIVTLIGDTLAIIQTNHFTDGLRPLVKSLFSPRPPWVAQKFSNFYHCDPP